MQITITVPDELGDQLQRLEKDLPQVLELAIKSMAAADSVIYQDESNILEFLAGQPTPKQVLALRASARLQRRASELLNKSKLASLSPQEEDELTRIAYLERLVQLAKAHASRQLAPL